MAETLTDSLTGFCRTVLSWSRVDTQEVGAVTNAKNQIATYNITDGDGPGEADLVFADERTIPANSVETFDLLNLTQQALGISVPFVFRQLRLIKVLNTATVAGCRLLVGCDAGSPSSIYAAEVGPGSEWIAINHVDAWRVTSANSVVRIANPTSSPITYQLYLIGTSTAAGGSGSGS